MEEINALDRKFSSLAPERSRARIKLSFYFKRMFSPSSSFDSYFFSAILTEIKISTKNFVHIFYFQFPVLPTG